MAKDKESELQNATKLRDEEEKYPLYKNLGKRYSRNTTFTTTLRSKGLLLSTTTISTRTYTFKRATRLVWKTVSLLQS
jgi:hypothetical protein